MISEFIKVPKERIGAIIGKNGETKRTIEQKTNTKIIIDSQEGEMEIKAKNADENFFKAVDLVKAIARGFSPENAFRLLSKENFLSIIDLSDVADTKKELEHKRGRIIGTDGKARNEIEQETNTNISVFGKTVSIIGTFEEIEKARKAIEMLLDGAPHSAVYQVLKKDWNKKKFEL